MIPRVAFCNKLSDLGFRYKRETDRVCLYKKPGNPDYVTVPRRDLIDEDYVATTLKRQGVSEEDAKRFVEQYRVH